MFQIVAWLAVGTMWCLLVTVDSQIPDIFFPFGPGAGDSPVPHTNAGLTLSFDSYMCSASNTEIMVSWDGFIQTNGKAIALFYTQHAWLPSINVYARTTNDKALMAQVSELVAAQCSLTFEPQNLLIATWENTTYNTGDESSPRNSYQLVLATDALQYTFAILNYDLTWSRRPGGSVAMPYIYCGTIFKLPWFGTSDIVKLGSESNVGTPGRWLYRVHGSTDFACLDINECASSPCLNGGTCIDGANRYTCSCQAGYTGVNCQSDINECASDPCLNGGTCVDAVNGYSCDCRVLYTGTNCELVTACQITSEDQRHSCGVASKTEQECINAGCCWDGTHANMICFRKIIRKCAVAESNRIRCPGVFTTEGECKAAACCWDSKPKPGIANCYLPE